MLDITQAVNVVKGCIDNNSIIKAYSYILIDNNRITAYNGEQAITARVTGLDNISCSLPGDLTIKIINSLDAKNATIEQNAEQNHLMIKSNKTKIKLATIPKDDFVFNDSFHKIAGGTNTKLTADIFEAFDKVKDTIESREAIVSKHGVFIFPDEKGGSTFYSTDSNQISRFKVPKTLLFNKKVQIPTTFCKLLLANKDSLLDGTLMITDKFIVAKSKGLSLFSHVTSDQEFLDFEVVIAGYQKKDSFKVPVVPEMSDAIDRCLIIQAISENKPIDITVGKSTVTFSSKSIYGVMNIPVKIPAPSPESIEIQVSGIFLKSLVAGTSTLVLSKSANVLIGTDKNLFRITSCMRSEE